MPPEQKPQDIGHIRAIEGLEAIRKRPGMYVGATPAAIHDMLYELLDNPLSEAMAGLCASIEITIHPDSSVTVSDDGEGIPVETHPHWDMSWLEICLTQLLAGRSENHLPYVVSGGIHGVGLKAVNALSEWLIVETRRDGHLWRQNYARGKRMSDLVKVRSLADSESTGTTMTFYPDDEIFGWKRAHYDFDYDMLSARCRQIAYVIPGVTVRLIDQREGEPPREIAFCFEGGLETYVKHLNRDRLPLHAPVSGTETVRVDIPYLLSWHEAEVSFAFQYTHETHTTEVTFVNTLATPQGGTHLTGLRTALTRTINRWARKTGNLRRGEGGLSGRATRKGLTAVVSIRHPNPQFESQSKVKLVNPEVKCLVASSVSKHFAGYLERNPEEAQRIFDHRRQAGKMGV